MYLKKPKLENGKDYNEFIYCKDKYIKKNIQKRINSLTNFLSF